MAFVPIKHDSAGGVCCLYSTYCEDVFFVFFPGIDNAMKQAVRPVNPVADGNLQVVFMRLCNL